MKRLLLALLIVVLCAGGGRADEVDSPHRMLKPDGSVDTDKCAACHEDDMSLSRSKLETCTLCHAATLHAGAAEHVQASAAAVARVVPKGVEPELPLTDAGQIFCGTCHFFHDPRVSEEKQLDQSWVPPSTGLPQAVRQSLLTQWEQIAKKYDQQAPGASFATHSTRAIRLPIADGTLCRHCHASLVK